MGKPPDLHNYDIIAMGELLKEEAETSDEASADILYTVEQLLVNNISS